MTRAILNVGALCLFGFTLIGTSFAYLQYNEATMVQTCNRFYLFIYRKKFNLYIPIIVKIVSEIYCYGDLLNTVQMAKIYPDSKEFVDLKLIKSPNDTLADFRVWQSTHPTPTPADVKLFVDVFIYN